MIEKYSGIKHMKYNIQIYYKNVIYKNKNQELIANQTLKESDKVSNYFFFIDVNL